MTTLGGGAPGGGGGFGGGNPGGNKKNKGKGKNKKPVSDSEEESSEEEIQTKGKKFDFSGNGKFDFSALGPEGLANLANDPNIVSLMQQKLGALGHTHSDVLDNLAEPVKGRVLVLKDLNDTRKKLEAEFKKEYEALQKKYRDLYQPLYDQRASIIVGATEPTTEEVAAARANEEAREKAHKEAGCESVKEEKEVKTEADVKGVPGFWLQALQHHVDLRDLVEADDEEALKHLVDIRWRPLEDNPVSFVLEFHFAENPFFEEKVLAKTYHMIENADSGDLHFSRVDSPTITWKAGKNLCVRQVTKQQKKRGGRRGKGSQTRTVTVEEPTNSFFHFFNPEAFLNLQPDLEEEDYEQFLEDDYVMGTEIKEKLIPYAVLYFTGEMAQDDEYEGGDEDDEDEEDEDEEDEDDEDDDGHVQQPAANASKPECNQQ
eukprot:TRINITY_DN11633_c0_g1_i1.p1 TRINITY_DN11633_c0_g1~~TRINITY_DN11633_c0_g1_i1.p1  ORF type:complete len:453 (-),score=139.02 TRINITY_DN11633_c0_g1_i1:107-1399(-)